MNSICKFILVFIFLAPMACSRQKLKGTRPASPSQKQGSETNTPEPPEKDQINPQTFDGSLPVTEEESEQPSPSDRQGNRLIPKQNEEDKGSSSPAYFNDLKEPAQTTSEHSVQYSPPTVVDRNIQLKNNNRIVGLRVSIAQTPSQTELENIKIQLMNSRKPEDIDTTGINMCDPLPTKKPLISIRVLAFFRFKGARYLFEVLTPMSYEEYTNSQWVEFNLSQLNLLGEVPYEQDLKNADLNTTSMTPLWVKNISKKTKDYFNSAYNELNNSFVLQASCSDRCATLNLTIQDKANSLNPLDYFEFLGQPTLRFQWQELKPLTTTTTMPYSNSLPRLESVCRDNSEPFIQLDGFTEVLQYKWNKGWDSSPSLKEIKNESSDEEDEPKVYKPYQFKNHCIKNNANGNTYCYK